MMKLVFVNSCPYFGGAEGWQLRTAEALRERGWEVLFAVRKGSPLAAKAKSAGFSCLELPLAFDLDLYSALRAFFWLRGVRPDLVMLNDQRECRLIAPAAAAAGVKTRVQRKGWPYLKGSWRDRLVYRFFITDLYANSQAVAEVFRRKSGLAEDRIRVLPVGVEVEAIRSADGKALREQLGLSGDDILIGSAGRLVSQKGFDILLSAFAKLRAKHENARLAIAGQGPDRKKLEGLARDLGVSSWVFFLGQVEDMASFYRGLDVFAFPSRMEGASNALAEAMAAGLAVAASDIPGNRDLIQHEKTGLLFPPEDPEALFAALSRLLEDRDLAEKLGEAAAGFAREQLDRGRALFELEAWLKSLVARDRGEVGRADDGHGGGR